MGSLRRFDAEGQRDMSGAGSRGSSSSALRRLGTRTAMKKTTTVGTATPSSRRTHLPIWCSGERCTSQLSPRRSTTLRPSGDPTSQRNFCSFRYHRQAVVTPCTKRPSSRPPDPAGGPLSLTEPARSSSPSRNRRSTTSTACAPRGHTDLRLALPGVDLRRFPHAMDTSDPAGPRIVHGFAPRDTDGSGSSTRGTR